MKLKLVKTLWGVDGVEDPEKWDAIFAKIKAEGFEAIEAITLAWRTDKEKFCSLLEKHGLSLICQIHTTGGDIDKATGEYQYCTSNKLHEHLASFRALCQSAPASAKADPHQQPLGPRLVGQRREGGGVSQEGHHDRTGPRRAGRARDPPPAPPLLSVRRSGATRHARAREAQD